MVATTAQLCSMKLELSFCACLNLICGVSEVCDGEKLKQWSWLLQKQFIIIRANISSLRRINTHCKPGGPKKKTHPNFDLQFLVNHRLLLRRILYTGYTFYLKSLLKFCERLLLKTIKYGML